MRAGHPPPEAAALVAAPPQLAARVPSLMFRGERHAGTNFLEAILLTSFERNAPEQWAAHNDALSKLAGCSGGYGVGTPCTTPHGVIAGCDSRASAGDASYCCWKHGYADPSCSYLPAATALVTVVRDPYAWLLAMYNEPYDTDSPRPASFSEWLRSPIGGHPTGFPYTHRDDRDDPVALWTAKVASYMATARAIQVVPLRTSDLFDPDKLERRLGARLGELGFGRATQPVQYPAFSQQDFKYYGAFTKAGFEAAQAYEREQAWRSSYSRADLEYINARLQPEQLEWLALEKLEPERRAAGNTTLLANAVVGVDPVAALDAMFARSALLANRTWVRS